MKRFLRILLPSLMLATFAVPLVGVGVASATATLALSGPVSGSVGTLITASSISVDLENCGSGSTKCNGTITFYESGPSASAPSGCPTGMTAIGTSVVPAGGNTGNGIVNPNSGFTPNAVGNYWLYAAYSGDSHGNGSAASPCPPVAAQEIVVGKGTQAPLTLTSTSGTYGTPMTLTSSGGTGTGAVSYAVTTAGSAGCTLTGGGTTITAAGAGTCTVTATKAADTNYNVTSSAPTTVTFAKATPTAPSISNLPGSGTFGGGFTATVSTTGDGVKSVTSNSLSVCTVAGLVVSYVGVGTCSLTAHVAAGTNFLAADGVAQTFLVGQATPSAPSISNLPGSGTFGGGFTATVSTTGDGVKSVTSNSTGVCTVAGLVVSYVGVGTCSLTAHVAAGTNYAAADGSPQTFLVGQASQAGLSLTSIAGTYGVGLTLTYFGGSGTGALSYSVSNGTASGCSETGGVLSVTSAGTCTVTVHKAADTNYLAVSSAPTTVTFTPAALLITASSDSKIYGAAVPTITPGYTGLVNGDSAPAGPPTCSTTALATSPVGTYVSSCTGATDANYTITYAPGVTTVTKAAQTITVPANPSGPWSATLSVATTATSSLPVSFALGAGSTASGCAVNGSGVVSATSAGTCVINLNQAGNANYLAAPQVVSTATFTARAQTTAVVVNTQASIPWSSSYTLVASGGNGTGGYTFSISGPTGVCSLVGNVLSSSGSGSCAITAVRNADGNYLVSPSSVPVSFIFTAKAQAPITLTSTSGTFGTGLAMTFTGGSGTGAVTYGVTNGTATGCVVTSGVLSSTSAGTCVVTVNKGGDANYLAASSAPTTVTLAAPSKVPTTTTMFELRSSIIYGDERDQVFTATVSGLTSNTLPTGTVTFKFGSTVLCSTSTFFWVNAHAVIAQCGLTEAQLPVGSYSVVAIYSGDVHYVTSTSSPARNFTVTKDSSKTVVSESAISAIAGTESSVTFTATVTSSHGEPVPSGYLVTIHVGAATCTGLTNASGVVTCHIANGVLAGGSYAVSATYAGDPNIAGSASTNSLNFSVFKRPAITSANSTTFSSGVSFSFHVTATGFPAPTFSLSGTVPLGVTINATTGVLSGTVSTGTYHFTIKATNSAGSTSQSFTLHS